MDEIKIDFIHTDGSTYQFRAKKNPLSGDWLYSFNNWQSCFATSSKREITTIVKNIKNKRPYEVIP